MKRKKYSLEQVKNAISSSYSICEVLSKLGLKPCGGNYSTFRNLVAIHSLDVTHFTGQGHSKGKILGPKRPLEEYLNNKHSIQSYKLKNRLLREGLLERKCSFCNLSTWLGKEIPLELDHINGINKDNTLTNLRLLCPNCHTLTPTYRGKNIKFQT